MNMYTSYSSQRGADGWAKNQLGEERLGELFFGRKTVGRQRPKQFAFLLVL